MKVAHWALLFFVLPLSHLNAQTSAPRGDLPAIIVLVRHAEFESEPGGNPHLNAAGRKRAQDLAAALAGMKFTAIITTQLFRTRETAEPISAASGVVPQIVPLMPGQATTYEQGVVEALRKQAGQSVLVVSHSRSGPAIVTAIGGPALPAICESVHDDLFVIVPTANDVQVIQSRYGEVSPTRGPNCK